MAGNQATSSLLRGKSLPKALPGIAGQAALGAAAGKLGGSDLFKGLTSRVRGLPLVNRIPGIGGIQLPNVGGANRAAMGVSDQIAGKLAGAFDVGGKYSSVVDPLMAGIKSTRRALGVPAINARNVASAAAGGAPTSGGGNVIDRIFGAIKGNPMQAAMLGLAGVSGVAAQDASRRSGRLEESALNRLRGEWTAGAPLREAGRARMLNPARPDLTSTFTWGAPPAPVAGVPTLPAPRARPLLANPLRKRKVA